MAWWLMAVMPTRRPARTSVWTRWAPQYVLPVPGGPWMEMQLPSSCVTHPHIASRSSAKTPPGGPPPGVKAGSSRRSRLSDAGFGGTASGAPSTPAASASSAAGFGFGCTQSW